MIVFGYLTAPAGPVSMMRHAPTGYGMLSFLHKYAQNVHSQNGEDGIVAECLRRFGRVPSVGHVVEIGANDGHWLSNSRFLIEWGWSAVLVEADWSLYRQCVMNWKDFPMVRCQCARVDENNVNAFVDDRCDVLSLDTDGSDYLIFDGLKARPKIVIAEIDSGLDPTFSSFNSDGAANYFAMTLLGITKGYFLLCHTGNMVFVLEQYRSLFPEIEGHPLSDIDLYFNRAWLPHA